MKAPQILLIILAFALGLGVMAAINSKKNGEDNNLDIASVKTPDTQVNTSTKALPASPAQQSQKPTEGLSALPAPANADDNEGEDEEINPEDAIAQIFNSPQARSLMKQFSAAMTKGADRWIEGAVNEYGEKLNLTEAQSASIKGRMASLMEDSSEKFQSELDDESRSMQEIMESQGDFWRNNEDEIEGILKEELSSEQFEQFERLQLEEDTENIQRRANWELGAIDRELDLSEAQEDQVFGILVRQSDDYDESMAIEGIETDLPAAALAEEVSKEDAIRSVLTPEQTETYNSKVEDGGFGRSGRGRWGRGFGRPR